MTIDEFKVRLEKVFLELKRLGITQWGTPYRWADMWMSEMGKWEMHKRRDDGPIELRDQTQLELAERLVFDKQVEEALLGK